MRRTRQCGGGAVRRCRAGMSAGEVRGGVEPPRTQGRMCCFRMWLSDRGPAAGDVSSLFRYIKTRRSNYVAVAQWRRRWSNDPEAPGSDLMVNGFFSVHSARCFFFSAPAAGGEMPKQQGTCPQTPAPMGGLQRASCVVCSFVRPLATAMCSKLVGRPCARVATGACHSTPACVHTSKAKRPRPRACSCAGLECQIPLKIQRKGSSGAQKGACS